MKCVLKVDPSRLPASPYPPTKMVRIIEKPDVQYEARDYASDYKADAEKMKERRKRAAASRAKTMQDAYTAEQEALITALYKQGVNYEDIAKKTGRTKQAIRQKIGNLRKKYGFNREAPLQRTYIHHKPESEIVRKKHYTPAQDAVIREMKAQGKSNQAIGEQIGKSKEAVRRRWERIR